MENESDENRAARHHQERALASSSFPGLTPLTLVKVHKTDGERNKLTMLPQHVTTARTTRTTLFCTRLTPLALAVRLAVTATLTVGVSPHVQAQAATATQDAIQLVAPADEAPLENSRAAPELPAVVVPSDADWAETTEGTGAYTVRRSDSATGLTQTLRETPQSISVITRPMMDDFNLNSVNDVLDAATGIVVEKVETDRTYYTARGFDIVNFQTDGIAYAI